jgi:hypothetical protein
VRQAATRQPGVDAVLNQGPLAVGLMLGSGAVQLRRVEDLASVVDRHPEPDELRVEGHAHALEARDDLLGGLAYQAQMGEEARRTAKTA